MNVIHTHLSTFTWLREQRSFYGNVLNVLPRQINFSMWWSNFRELFRFQILALDKLLKTSQNKKDLNDVTAAWFLVRFFAAGSWEKDTKNRAAVMFFLFCDDFNQCKIKYFLLNCRVMKIRLLKGFGSIMWATEAVTMTTKLRTNQIKHPKYMRWCHPLLGHHIK